jgi:hypothetical protein
MSQALIVRDDAKLTITFTKEARRQKSEALEVSALIGKVTNADENAKAVAAQTLLQSIVSLTEKARKACKEPVLEYGRAIDESARQFIEEPKSELTRVSAIVGDFAALELAKQNAAERLRNAELADLDRQRAEAQAKATSHDALDAINAHFDNKAKDVAPPPASATRASGQRIANDWEIVVTDIHLLYRHHPNCVKLEALTGEIKNILKAGGTVKGVNAKPIVKAGVRAPRQREAIAI